MSVSGKLFDWDDFVGELLQAKTRESAKKIFDSLLKRNGISLSLYADIQDQKNISESVSFLDNFPKSYMQHYIDMGYADHDLATRHCLVSAQPFIWSKFDKQLKHATKIERAVREESIDENLKAGVSFPLHHATNTTPATLSLATDGDVNEFNNFIEANLDSFYLASIYFHSILQTLPYEDNVQSIPELSNRQQEVLKWILSNKRTKEIADILNLSERTVNLHIGIAMKKLSAKSRFEAAALASKYGLI